MTAPRCSTCASTCARASTARSADAAFAATLRPLVDAALAPRSIDSRGSEITIVDRGAEDAWLRDRFYPGRWPSSIESSSS